MGCEPLAALFAAGAAGEGQPRLHLGDEGIQRWRAVQQGCHDRLPGVNRVGQVATCDQSVAGLPTCLENLFGRLEPAAQDRVKKPRLTDVLLVAPGLTQRQDPPYRPLPGSV